MQILATSGGFRLDHREQLVVGPLLRHAFSLSGRPTSPRVCFVPTAGGERPEVIARACDALTRAGATASYLTLFPWPNVEDVTAHLLAQDVVWVGGGSVVNLLALWRAHGVDAGMRVAWEAGVVLGGVSAGSLCWHTGGTTDSFGPDLRLVTAGLGLLPHSNTPHYDSEPGRRPLFQSLVAAGSLAPGWATDDGVGLHFRGTDLVEALADREDVAAWRVEPDGGGGARETRVDPKHLH